MSSYVSSFGERPSLVCIDVVPFCVDVLDQLVQACVRDPSPLRDKPKLAYLATLLNPSFRRVSGNYVGTGSPFHDRKNLCGARIESNLPRNTDHNAALKVVDQNTRT